MDQNSELKELFNDIEKTVKDDVKIIMKLSKIKLMKNFKVLKKTCFNAETDDPITIKEIQFVLNKLKNGKAGGPDGIIK